MKDELELMSEEEARRGGLLRPGEQLDDLQRDGYRIIQDRCSFRFGIDAVLLSAFAEVRPGERVLDLGTGTGILPILLSARTDGAHFTGLEINEASADMAERSVRLNRLTRRISIVRGDIKEADRIFPVASFHVVVSNPPYLPARGGRAAKEEGIAASRQEILCTLDDVSRAASRMLGSQGRCYLVHRPFRLAEIIRSLSAYRLEPKRMRLVYPFREKQPSMVLIEARKGGRPQMRVEPPLIIYDVPGVYTEEVRGIYGNAEG